MMSGVICTYEELSEDIISMQMKDRSLSKVNYCST